MILNTNAISYGCMIYVKINSFSCFVGLHRTHLLRGVFNNFLQCSSYNICLYRVILLVNKRGHKRTKVLVYYRRKKNKRAFGILYIQKEELHGLAISALWRAIADVKQRWSVIGWVAKNLLSRALRASKGTEEVKLLVLLVFEIVSTHQPALSPSGRL
jgi:hypothetical protein